MEEEPLRPDIIVGSKLFFPEYRRPFTVTVRGKRFAIALKPFNLQQTYLYTIIDFEECIRGRNNLIWNMYEYSDKEQAERSLRDLERPEEDGLKLEISRRNRVDLVILKVVNH